MITIDGSDLFFAFRIVTFKNLDSSISKIMVDGDTSDLRLFIPNVIKTSVDSKKLHECICSEDSKLSLDDCLETIPIKISVITKTLITGGAVKKTFDYKIGVDTTFYTSLDIVKELDLPEGVAYTAIGMSLDIPKPTKSAIGKGYNYSCSTQIPTELIPGHVRTQSFELKPLAKPKAAGWVG